ncbi:hypothetical protein SY88_09740 [Clostridiales bacterium PH28_bin88]|nr:hypothetical protein SY88_09740 [Clostridiales bacterium PH28_bin88]
MLTDTNSQEKYVTFNLAGERYGIPVQKVQEIIRLPEITKVPQAPGYVEGLANLRGMIVTVVNGRGKMGLLSQEHDDATRVLILALDTRTAGYLVDSISEVLSVSQADVEKVPDDLPNQGYLTGLVRADRGVVMLLDPEKVVGTPVRLSNLHGEKKGGNREVSRQVADSGRETKAKELQLVSFTVGTEEYALDLKHVREIVGYPEHLSVVPTFPSYAEGIMVLRDNMLPVISLAKLIGAAESEDKSRSRVVVLTGQGKGLAALGMAVDSVSEVLRVVEDTVGELPEYLADSDNVQLAGICKLETGKRLVYLLDPAFLLSMDEIRLVGSQGANGGNDSADSTGTKSNDGQYILFKLGGQDFVTDISSVREILNVPDIFTVPQAPRFVEGVINIRGRIIPVVDLRKRLDLGCVQREEQNRIAVVDLGGNLTGFIVDAVKEVRRISVDDIEPPSVLSGVGLDLEHITGIAKINKDGQVAMVLDLQCLLTGFERKILSTMNKEGNDAEAPANSGSDS